jgi:hypothetical protein
MAEEPRVLISDKLSRDIGHPQTKPRHRKGYGVWVTQNAPAKWKKRPLNFQALEYRRSGSDTTLVDRLTSIDRCLDRAGMRWLGYGIPRLSNELGQTTSAAHRTCRASLARGKPLF